MERPLIYNLQYFGGRGASSTAGSGKVTADEIDALDWYVSGEGMWVNNALRGRNPDITTEDLTPLEKEAISNLDKLTNREAVGETTLYRTVDASAVFDGITDNEYEALKNVIVYNDNQNYYKAAANNAMNKLVNSYTEKGYMSTTKDMSIAENNAFSFGSDKPIILEVKTNSKTRGVDVNKHANAAMKAAEAYDPQKEVLLARNQKWGVNKKISATKDGFIKVTIRQN